MRNIFFKLGFWGRGFVLLCLTVFLLLAAIVIGELTAFFIFGRDAVAHSDVEVMQWLQSIMAIGLFLLPPVLMVKLCCEGLLWSNLMTSRPPKVLPLLVCVGAILVSAPMVSWLEDVNLRMTLPESMQSIESWMRAREDAAAELVGRFTNSPDPARYAINIIVLALLPALCEEMYFRVGVQTRLLSDKSSIRGYWAVVLAAVLFSALHLQFYGFLPRLVLGALLGVMLLFTGNVWYSVLAHFVNNMIAVTIAYIEARGVELAQPQWMETWWMALLSCVTTVGMMLLLSRLEKKEKKF